MKKFISQISLCPTIAHKLAKVQISEEAIEKILRDLFHKAHEEGYEKRRREEKDFKDKRLSSLELSWKAVDAEIDDRTHGGIRNQKTNK
jgi:DNA-binding protein YbaB